VGSDGTGYLDTRGFGLGVEKVLNGPRGPAAAVVDLGSGDVSTFRLSGGVAAAAAAFDSAAVLYELDVPGLTELGQLVAGGVLNLYLGLETPNFARRYDEWWSTPYDYTRMVTVERVPRWHTTSARWLYITDGGHYDNLGVLSLLRRGVPCIVAVDATADASHRYDDLKTLRRRAQQELHLEWIDRLPPDGEDTQAAYRFRVADRSGNVQSIVLYLKASADPGLPHLKELPDFSRSQAMRQIEAIHRADLASVDALFDEIDRAIVDVPPRSRADLDSGRRAAIHELLAVYYQSIVTRADTAGMRATALQARIDALRKQVADAELQLVAAQGKREETERQLSDLKAALTSQQQMRVQAIEEQLGTADEVTARIAAMEADLGTFRDTEEQYKKAIETAWADIRKLTPQLAASKGPEVPPPDDVTQALVPVFAAIRNVGNRDREFAERAEVSEQRFNLTRQRNARRLARAFHDYRDWAARDEARATRIRKILSFANSPKGRGAFPHDSTLKQSYEWERFEAYRMLGFQMASTFIDQFEPGGALDWCDFAR